MSPFSWWTEDEGIHDVELREAQPCQGQAVDNKYPQAAADWLHCSGRRLF